MYTRLLKKQIINRFFDGKAIIIVGARQTGKTTLGIELLKEAAKKVRMFNCDNPTDREVLTNKDLEFLVRLVGDAKIVFIDEGQKVKTIGQTVKLLVDHYKTSVQIIVTGSSSFNLLDMVEETLTGRKYVYHLYPLSLEEIHPEKDPLAIAKYLEERLIFGSFPEIITRSSFDDKEELLYMMVSSTLYKDIFEFQEIRNSSLLNNLVKALALQIGSEVSFTELSNLLGVDKKTVERYIDLLEKSFIVFQLSAYAKNKRREITKKKKIYFYDLGIRNAVISNMNFLDSRNDVGALWENFLASERVKYQAYHSVHSQNFFWRTYDGSEVDWVEERNGKLYGFEFKFSERTTRASSPKAWSEYPHSSYSIVTPHALEGFIL